MRQEETAKLSIDYVRIRTAMPSDADADRMKRCTAPALVMGAEKIIPNCRTYLLRGRGHMHFLTDEEKKMIADFLK